MIMAAVGLGVSLIGASANNKAAQKSMRAQAKADEASRRATANSMIAQTQAQNWKVKEMERMGQIMAMQGKADAMIRTENYNDVQAMAMVMGAASGRTTGSGSVGAIMDKSNSDYMWDQMWAANSLTISQAALEQDKANIYRAGSTSLMLGKEQLGVARLGSMAGQQNTAANAQQAFNNTMVSAGQSVLNNYGSSLFKGSKSLLGSTKSTLGGN